MLSEPSTPTTATSVTMSDLSYQDISSDVQSAEEGTDLREHPTLFVRDEMVTICIDKTLFRVQRFVLSRCSSYFDQVLSEQTNPSEALHITDSDVSSSAFANLLYVLYPPQFGFPTVTTLPDWTDVLQLSTKWDFKEIRSTAIKAITPLASPVDKVAIGRLHGIEDWIPDALVDLLTREEDLTLEEARRLPLEDVVAIARGRRLARSALIKPKDEVRKIVVELYSARMERPNLTTSPTETLVVTPSNHTATRRKISRWLTMLDSSSQQAPATRCIQQMLEKEPSHLALVIEMALQKGCPVLERSTWKPESPSSTAYLYDGPIRDLMRAINATIQDRRFNKCLAEVFLVLVDRWSGLFHLDSSTVEAQTTIKTIAAWTKYLRYYVTCCGFIEETIFRDFWTTISHLSHSLIERSPHLAVDTIKRVLSEIAPWASVKSLSLDIDTFYEALERIRDDNGSDSVLVAGIGNVINDRKWI